MNTENDNGVINEQIQTATTSRL